MKKPLIFISWSGEQSEEMAKILHDFMWQIFDIEKSDIFLSTEDLHGSQWEQEIIDKAANAKVGIFCFTKENIESPWIFTELGAVNVQGWACPILCDMSIKYFASKNLPILPNTMYRTIISPKSQSNNSKMSIVTIRKKYKKLLTDLVLDVLDTNKKSKKRIFNKSWKNSDDVLMEKQQIIEETAQECAVIYMKYNCPDFFISRPIRDVDSNANYHLEQILSEIEHKTTRKLFWATTKTKQDTHNLVNSRLDLIAKSKVFVLIYPYENTLPSSCLVELGAALMKGLKIIFCIKKHTNLPQFVKECITNTDKYEVYEVENMEELSEILQRIII